MSETTSCARLNVAPNGVRWRLDGCTLVMLKKDPNGTLEFRMGWDFDPSDALIEKAIDGFASRGISEDTMPGQRDRHRWVGPCIFTVSTGPPTFRLPKFEVRLRPRPSIYVGWLRAAIAVAWMGHRRARSDD